MLPDINPSEMRPKNPEPQRDRQMWAVFVRASSDVEVRLFCHSVSEFGARQAAVELLDTNEQAIVVRYVASYRRPVPPPVEITEFERA